MFNVLCCCQTSFVLIIMMRMIRGVIVCIPSITL